MRRCRVSFFEHRNRNNETVKRACLCFSPSQGKVYCFVCKVMTAKNSYLTHDGFGHWKHANERFVEHEQSKDHLDAVVALLHRSKELHVGRIDSELALQTQERLSQLLT